MFYSQHFRPHPPKSVSFTLIFFCREEEVLFEIFIYVSPYLARLAFVCRRHLWCRYCRKMFTFLSFSLDKDEINLKQSIFVKRAFKFVKKSQVYIRGDIHQNYLKIC